MIPIGIFRSRLETFRNFSVSHFSMKSISVVGVLLALSAANAAANDLAPVPGTWFTQNGPISVEFRRKSSVDINGARAAGVEANPDDGYTLSDSIGYYITPRISAQLVLGITPETDVKNQAGARLGTVTYGAPSFLVDYRLTELGALQPFVGIGGMYLFFKDERDGVLENLKVDDAFGLILRAGAEVMLDHRFGLYAAANKVFIDTEARGNIGAAAVKADLELDPWIFQTGVTYRF